MVVTPGQQGTSLLADIWVPDCRPDYQFREALFVHRGVAPALFDLGELVGGPRNDGAVFGGGVKALAVDREVAAHYGGLRDLESEGGFEGIVFGEGGGEGEEEAGAVTEGGGGEIALGWGEGEGVDGHPPGDSVRGERFGGVFSPDHAVEEEGAGCQGCNEERGIMRGKFEVEDCRWCGDDSHLCPC